MPAEIPKHGPQFVVFVKTNPMIDGVKLVCVILKEDVTALSISVVAKQIEEHDRFEKPSVFISKIKVVIFGIVIDILLERTRSIRTIIAECGEWDYVKAKRLADKICRDLTPCQRVLREIPKGLLAAQGFVNGGIILPFMMDSGEEGVIRAKGELTFDLKVAALNGCS